uniref:Uncharacterized protein n=1 Tax=Arundo donax TaxID=35708 RepID=A0A0A8ZA51_ARUDO
MLANTSSNLSWCIWHTAADRMRNQ